MDDIKKFEKLEKEFFNDWIAAHPLLGTALGFHEWDDKLPHGGYEKIQDDIKMLKGYQQKFEKFSPKLLPEARRIDRELALHICRTQLFHLEELRMWESVPDAPRFIGESIYQLLGRNYAPLNERMQGIIRRLEELPRWIKQSLTRLRRPIRLFVENELETVTRLAGFFHNLKEIGKENLSRKDVRRLCKAVEDVQDAIEDLCDTLVIDILPDADEHHAMSEGMFKRLLKVRGVEESPDELIRMAEREYARLEEKLKDVARAIRRKTRYEDVRDIVKGKHPDNFEGVMEFVRDMVKKTREFVHETRFATVPHHESLYVVETPAYLRHTMPLAAYWAPGKYEKAQHGYFFVTPPDCETNRLREHNFASLSNLSVHEAYPGHHLQAACANMNKSLIRTFADDPLTIEGWAHYCEEKLKEMGFDDTPDNVFMQSVDQMWRAARVVIDVKLSTGQFSPKEAVAYLAEHTGMDWVCAEAEIRRYLITPTYPLSYMVGKERIKKLKAEVRDTMKTRYNDQFFHDTILYAGALPMHLLRREFEWKIKRYVARAAKQEAMATVTEVKPKKGKPAAKNSRPDKKTPQKPVKHKK